MSFAMPVLVVAQEGAELEVLGDREPGEDVASLGGVGEAQGDDLVGGDAVEGLAVEEDAAAAGLEEPGEGAQGGGLAGAVGADEGDDLAGFDGEGDALDGFDLAVGDLEVLDLEQCGHWSPRGGRCVPVTGVGRRRRLSVGWRLRPAASTSAISSVAGGAFEGGAEVGGDDAFVALDDVGGAFDELFALDEDRRRGRRG